MLKWETETMLGAEKKHKENVFGRQNNNSLKKEGRKESRRKEEKKI